MEVPEMPLSRAIQVLKRHLTHQQKEGISDEELYAGDGQAAQEADRLSTSGSDMEATTETDAERQQHSV
jgi:hypothetical protein